MNHLYLFDLLHRIGMEKNEVFMNTEKELLKYETLSFHWMKHLTNFLTLAEYGCFDNAEDISNRMTSDLLVFSDMPIHQITWISTSEHSELKASIMRLNELSQRINQLIRDLEIWFEEHGYEPKDISVQKIIHNVHRGLYNAFEKNIERIIVGEIALLPKKESVN